MWKVLGVSWVQCWYQVMDCRWMKRMWLPTNLPWTKAATALVARRSMWGGGLQGLLFFFLNFCWILQYFQVAKLWFVSWGLRYISSSTNLPVFAIKIYHHSQPTTKEQGFPMLLRQSVRHRQSCSTYRVTVHPLKVARLPMQQWLLQVPELLQGLPSGMQQMHEFFF